MSEEDETMIDGMGPRCPRCNSMSWDRIAVMSWRCRSCTTTTGLFVKVGCLVFRFIRDDLPPGHKGGWLKHSVTKGIET